MPATLRLLIGSVCAKLCDSLSSFIKHRPNVFRLKYRVYPEKEYNRLYGIVEHRGTCRDRERVRLVCRVSQSAFYNYMQRSKMIGGRHSMATAL